MSDLPIDISEVLGIADVHAEESREDGCRVLGRGDAMTTLSSPPAAPRQEQPAPLTGEVRNLDVPDGQRDLHQWSGHEWVPIGHSRPAPQPLSDQDRADAEAYRRINTPEIVDFLAAVKNEALHQRERWGSEHDAGKTDADWFWLLGFLAGKAIRPDATPEKRLHHIITTAAACLNWHAAAIGAHTGMRPGIEPPQVS